MVFGCREARAAATSGWMEEEHLETQLCLNCCNDPWIHTVHISNSKAKAGTLALCEQFPHFCLLRRAASLEFHPPCLTLDRDGFGLLLVTNITQRTGPVPRRQVEDWVLRCDKSGK